MRLIEKLKVPSTLNLFFATILIVPLQIVLLIPISLETLSTIREEPSYLFQNNPMIIFIFLLLPIIYCIVISLFFQPKRLVSPINIQILTSVLFAQIVLNSIMDAELTLDIFINIFGNLIFIFIILIEIGLFQFLCVRLVIGLNYKDSVRKSYIINLSPKDVINILKDSNFHKSRKFKILKINKNTNNPLLILRFNDFKEHIIIAFGNYRNEKNKCVLAIAAFHKDLSWISKSEYATHYVIQYLTILKYV